HVQQMLGGGQVQFRVPQVLSLPAAGNAQTQRYTAEAQRAHAEAQQAQAAAQRQMLREYRVKVQPQARDPMIVSPPIAFVPNSDQGVQAKLDAILKRLDQPQGDALQRLQVEVEKLRKEVEDLRQGKK
ncbi:MAG: hypothetical protein WEH44_07395, partial [Pirellulaceae bacterium]